jgi:hypothetical protein
MLTGCMHVQVSYSGYRCAARYWPEVFAGTDLQTKLQVLAALARVRSVLVHGYETMIMVSIAATNNKILLVLGRPQNEADLNPDVNPCLKCFAGTHAARRPSL